MKVTLDIKCLIVPYFQMMSMNELELDFLHYLRKRHFRRACFIIA